MTGLVVVEARDDHLFLDSIAVHPGAWGQGVGRRLLPAEEAGQWLKKNQARDQHQSGRQRRARPGRLRRLLKLLFSPRPNSNAA